MDQDFLHGSLRMSGLEVVRNGIEQGYVPGPFYRMIGLRVVEAGPGTVTMACTVTERLHLPIPRVPGAVASAMIELSGALAVQTLLEAGDVSAVRSLSVDFLEPFSATDGTVTVLATVDVLDESTGAASATVRHDDGTELARGRIETFVTRRRSTGGR